jgi:hypothetical protein
MGSCLPRRVWLSNFGCPRDNFAAIFVRMAWRIDESVIRGEIDNRVRGRVTGRIWFVGREAPVEFEFAGNAWRDLAGRRLEFVNPAPKPGRLETFAGRQTGVIGDCTASRKVKVPDIPMEQIGEYYAARKPFPWHWGNSLYFEWFSTTNGRVVIESASFQLTISPDIAWEMTSAEEDTQRRANAEATRNLMDKLGEAAARAGSLEAKSASTDAEWCDNKPLTEEEAEKMQEESDRLVDRIQARLEREGPDADYAKILEEELEQRRIERGEEPLTFEEEAERAEWGEEMNRAAEEVLSNPDPDLEAEFRTKHPVAEQASGLAIRLRQEMEARDWVPADASIEHPVVDMVSSAMSAGAKFAGGLNGEVWPPAVDSCAGRIVRLKRARGYLDHALFAAEACAQQKLVDAAWLAGVQRELNTLAHACDEHIG